MPQAAWAESTVLYDGGERKKDRKLLQRQTLVVHSRRYDYVISTTTTTTHITAIPLLKA
jgi:hypothetical protein